VRRHRLPSLLALTLLGELAGAVLTATLHAQVPVRRDTVSGRKDTLPSRADTARARAVRPPPANDTIRVPLPPRADTVLKNDSTRLASKMAKSDTAKTKADTIKPALARAPAPPIIEIGPPRIYDRAALFATGSLTLSDLLGRLPGLTEYTAGWEGAPAAVAYLGDVRRIRLFLDNVEIEPLNPRMRGAVAVNDLPLHALEELRIERGADELRVYARSWRVDRTTPYTRADVFTGDQNTNLYRAFFGRRFRHGEAFQVAVDQYNTQPIRALPSSDALNIMLRVGTTHGPWKADLFAERSSRNRGEWVGFGGRSSTVDTITGLSASGLTAYARLGNGDPDRGRWFQLQAAGNKYTLSPRTSNNFLTGQSDSTSVPDTSLFVGEYIASGGVTSGPFRVWGTERLRTHRERSWSTPSANAAVQTDLVAVSLRAEGSSPLFPSQAQATARITPFGRLALFGTVSRSGSGTFERVLGDTVSGRTIDPAGVYQPGPQFFFPGFDSLEVARYELEARTSMRLEAGVRLKDLWISGGVIRRGATTLLSPEDLLVDKTAGTRVRTEGEANARTVSVRGRLYKSLYADAWGIAWDDTTGVLRPRYQSRSELYIQTNLLNRFPSGNFGLLASLAHDYRSTVRFPLLDGGLISVPDTRVVSFRLEIRVQTAVVSYQFRNVLQERYRLIPGFEMPRQTQLYGVRWDFWN
jgi:hypothetical protein